MTISLNSIHINAYNKDMSDQKLTKNKIMEITDSAAKRIAAILADKSDPDLNFRVRVDGGGCNGFQYIFDFDTSINDDDTAIEKNGINVLIDEVSMELLKGSELDYIEELAGSYFRVNNPNASSSCGCGTSFSV